MSNKYYRGLRNIINDTKYKLQLASMNLKINENKNSISGIKNDISEINNFSDKINDNETNISDNLSKINNIENDLSDLDSNILSNKSLIETNTSDISNNSGLINTNTSDISNNSGLISTNTSSIASNLLKINDNSGLIITISSNSSKLSNLDIDVKKDIYKKTFNIENFETTSNFKLIFEKQIDFKFTKTGVIKIKANYEYLNTEFFSNNKHRHIYIFQNNRTVFKQVDIDHYSKIVNDEFSIPSTIESENIDLLIYSVNPFSNNSKITLNKNSTEFIYNDFTKILKTDYNLEKINTNEGNISSNKGLIDTNTSSISDNKTLIEANQSDISDNFGKIGINTGSIASNLEKINDNKDYIVALQTSNVKAFYNLDQIFIYDIEKRNQTVNKNNHFHIFEKEITYNFTKNSYLEIALKILTKLSNYVLIGFFQILCNFYDQDNNLFYTISLSTAAGSTNSLSTIKSVFIVPINENMSKIKIDFSIAPIETQQHRSGGFTIQDINSNKIYIKYFQKTDEMSIKDIQDALDNNNGKNINSEQVNTNTTDIADNLGKIGNNTTQINKNTIDIADNLRKIDINTVDISTNLSDINNIKKNIYVKKIYILLILIQLNVVSQINYYIFIIKIM